jgi:diguanylate cyclase
MPATDESDGAACLERVRRRLSAQTFDDIVPGLRVTFSAGVAGCAGEHELELAIEHADRAMYAAKHGGRDRIVRHAGDVPTAPLPAETADVP